MENPQAILALLEPILGRGKRTSNGNMAFKCPICHHPKFKLEIQLETDENGNNPYHCWTCEITSNMRGRKLSTLLKKLRVGPKQLEEANILTRHGIKREIKEYVPLSLPSEFISLIDIDEIRDRHNQITAKHALKYLSSRKVSELDIQKYNIGFCASGNYAMRIIVPSYDELGRLNYYTARSFEKEAFQKYKNPPAIAKEIIGFELYINWNLPIIITEGIFDSIAVKRNAIPLFGKIIHDKLLAKLIENKAKKVYIALDADAIKDALKQCEKLLSYNIEVYLVEMTSKDFSETKPQDILEILEDTYPLTYNDIIKKKLELI